MDVNSEFHQYAIWHIPSKKFLKIQGGHFDYVDVPQLWGTLHDAQRVVILALNRSSNSLEIEDCKFLKMKLIVEDLVVMSQNEAEINKKIEAIEMLRRVAGEIEHVEVTPQSDQYFELLKKSKNLGVPELETTSSLHCLTFVYQIDELKVHFTYKIDELNSLPISISVERNYNWQNIIDNLRRGGEHE
jgi:hypothetical protein